MSLRAASGHVNCPTLLTGALHDESLWVLHVPPESKDSRLPAGPAGPTGRALWHGAAVTAAALATTSDRAASSAKDATKVAHETLKGSGPCTPTVALMAPQSQLAFVWQTTELGGLAPD